MCVCGSVSERYSAAADMRIRGLKMSASRMNWGEKGKVQKCKCGGANGAWGVSSGDGWNRSNDKALDYEPPNGTARKNDKRIVILRRGKGNVS